MAKVDKTVANVKAAPGKAKANIERTVTKSVDAGARRARPPPTGTRAARAEGGARRASTSFHLARALRAAPASPHTVHLLPSHDPGSRDRRAFALSLAAVSAPGKAIDSLTNSIATSLRSAQDKAKSELDAAKKQLDKLQE
eukprot:532786-Prymnesium_polylepis.1